MSVRSRLAHFLGKITSSRRRSRWRNALALMAFVVLVGSVGFSVVADLPLLEALYLTLITISTIGYSDTALQHARQLEAVDPGITQRVMVFEVAFIIFGVVAIFYAFSVIVQSLIEGELREAIGRHGMRRRVRFMNNHFIICGFGRMGTVVAEAMQREQIPVVVVDSNPDRRAEIEERGLVCLVGDATHDELLREAAIEKARGLIAVTNSDPENLFITLSARQMNKNLMIVSRALSEEVERKLLRAGANRVILPYKLGAHQLAQAALRPNVVDLIEIATRTARFDIEIEELKVAEGSELAEKALHEAGALREFKLIVIGIRRALNNSMEFKPSADTVIHGGDTLIVMGSGESLNRIRKRLGRTKPTGKGKD